MRMMNLKREKREPYKQNESKKYEDLKRYFFENEIIFDKLGKDKNADKIIKNIDVEKTYLSRVWLLFASNNNKDWDCVQVAQSRKEVRGEIEDAIINLYADFEAFEESKYTNSVFYKNICPPTTGKEYNKRLYSKIGSEYTYFRFCLLDVDDYLGIEKTIHKKNDAEMILDICKNQYAEAKIAYQTLAIYWRLCSSGVDGQTIQYIADNKLTFSETQT